MGVRHKKAALSLKQQRFVKEYAHLGNASAAARKAGYPSKAAAAVGYENLRKPHVLAAVTQAVARFEVDYGPERVKRRLDAISHAAEGEGQFGAAVRAEELLGKAAGMWIDMQLTGALNDEHITALLSIARARQAEPIDLVDDQAVRVSDDE